MDIISRIDTLERFGIKPGLERISALLSYFDHPELAYKTILVGGTNGKGSTCAMIDSILRASGYKTGLYTSPHLIRQNERIVVNHEMIDDNSLNDLAHMIFKIIENHHELSDVTYFEFMTGLAFLYFKYKKVDIAILEVGMGGRFDATNVVTSEISIITNIALDHQQFLGNTVEQIAFEKAGIIKTGKSFITTDTNSASRHVIEQLCYQKGGIFYGINHNFFVSGNETNMKFKNNRLSISNLVIPLKGKHQLLNAAAAIQAVLLLDPTGTQIQENTIRQGLLNTSWPGRFEIVRKHPDIILDSAHNPAGIQSLVQTVKDYYQTSLQNSHSVNNLITIVFAVSKDKDWHTMIHLLTEISNVFILTSYKGERSTQPEFIANFIRSINNTEEFRRVEVIKSSKLAIKRAIDITPNNGIIVVSGSIFLIGEIKKEKEL